MPDLAYQKSPGLRPKRGRNTSGAAWAGVAGTILLVLATCLWVFSQRLSVVDEAVGGITSHLSAATRSNDKFGFGRTVTIVNKFHHSVHLYVEDGMSGSFVAEIPSEESAKIGASNGHILYATEPTGWTRIATLVIRTGEDNYALQPSISDQKLLKKRNASKTGTTRTKVNLEVEKRTRPHPSVVQLKGPKTTAMSAKFRSMSPRKVEMWYDDGGSGTESGHLVLGQETTTNTYEGHVFYFTVAGHKDQVLARFTMNPNQVLYVVYDKKRPPPAEMLAATRKEEQFMAEYYNRTGIHWRHYFGPDGPRPPPELYMWPAKQVGTVHTVQSPEGYWKCDGPVTECQSSAVVPLELEVVSLEPRVFIIPQFLSDFEAEHIAKIARPRMASSSVGDVDSGVFSSNTRTSRNAWVARKTTSVTESLFIRAADLLNIDEKLLTREKNAEDLQVVHYVNGQKYDSHHDWGVSGHPQSRLITLLIYLTDQETPKAGGETSFPKGGASGTGFKVRPAKGQAVLFYNLLEDGNGDDKALHAALPCVQGEKLLANFWVWDDRFL